VLHWSDAGAASWYDVAVAVGELGEELGLLERMAQVNPITTADYPTPAQRPSHSLLDCTGTVEPGPAPTPGGGHISAAIKLDRSASQFAMDAVWSLQDAKNRFSAVVDAAARGEPQMVTRRGKWVSVVLSAEEYERLQRLERASAPSLGELLLQMPQDDEPFERLPLAPREFPCI
jgi:antitoxin Phd